MTTPLEMHLRTAKELWDAATSGAVFDRELAKQACAIGEKVLPYMHPRLSSVEAQVAITGHEAAFAELA